MKTLVKIATFVFLIFSGLRLQAQTKDSLFPRGEISTTKNHTGTVWLKELNEADSIFNYSIAVATFEAGAKLDWHIHPAGQILLISEGTGYYQERGKPIQIVQMSSRHTALAWRFTGKWLYLHCHHTCAKR